MSKHIQLDQKFKNICVTGLNRVEYLPEHTNESIFADSWQDIIDEQNRANTALLFFAPRELDGSPVDPYVYLSESEDNDEQSALMAQQAFGNTPLIDMCRLRKGPANVVQIIIAADVIYHWDMKDSYVQPTNPLTWVKDLRFILKSYPNSTEKIIYTHWDNSKLSEFGVTIKPLSEIVVPESVWINKPSFQQQNGTLMMAAAIIVMLVAYAFIFMQERELNALSQQIRQVENETPAGKNYNELNRAMAEQQAFMRYNDLTPLVIKDIGYAIQSAGMKIQSLEIKTPDSKKPSQVLIAHIKSQKGAYKGWLEEEPIAKAVLGQSLSLSAVRRPPSASQFTIEGLIELDKLSESVRTYRAEAEEQKAQSLFNKNSLEQEINISLEDDQQ